MRTARLLNAASIARQESHPSDVLDDLASGALFNNCLDLLVAHGIRTNWPGNFGVF